MKGPEVLVDLYRHAPRPPPLTTAAVAWLHGTAALSAFEVSRPTQVWGAWLCVAWLALEHQVLDVPSLPDGLHAQAWRDQADRAEDLRESCPDDAWLTIYVTYLHACADILETVEASVR